jgi:RNA-binding protein
MNQENTTMPDISNAQRAQLRRLAHDLKPLVQVGKNGLTDGVLDNLEQALDNHELVKVKFLDFQDQKHELTREMVQSTGSFLVGLIGNVATLYRQQPDPERRKIEL